LLIALYCGSFSGGSLSGLPPDRTTTDEGIARRWRGLQRQALPRRWQISQFVTAGRSRGCGSVDNGNRIAVHAFDRMIFQRFASARVSPMAVLLLVMLAFAPSDVNAQSDDDLAKEVTLVGCVQREKNYHKEHRRVDSGPFALGFGVGKKYMLVNATWIDANTPRPEKDSCSPETWGRVFELTDGKDKVKPFIGQWVEITGTRKKLGGSKMFEIDVESVRTYMAPAVVRAGP
jgi:hypothetical protein